MVRTAAPGSIGLETLTTVCRLTGMLQRGGGTWRADRAAAKQKHHDLNTVNNIGSYSLINMDRHTKEKKLLVITPCDYPLWCIHQVDFHKGEKDYLLSLWQMIHRLWMIPHIMHKQGERLFHIRYVCACIYCSGGVAEIVPSYANLLVILNWLFPLIWDSN